MNKTLALMEVLDAQLNILNIEGFRSEHQIYTGTETETTYVETECCHCKGSGEVFIYEWGDWHTCPECDGAGSVEIMKDVEVPYWDSYTESNIVI
jgi:DnaJ-class molecular chaperone